MMIVMIDVDDLIDVDDFCIFKLPISMLRICVSTVEFKAQYGGTARAQGQWQVG